jgi:hypothetical protein
VGFYRKIYLSKKRKEINLVSIKIFEKPHLIWASLHRWNFFRSLAGKIHFTAIFMPMGQTTLNFIQEKKGSLHSGSMGSHATCISYNFSWNAWFFWENERVNAG